MYELHDLVKVIKADDDLKDFIGKEGIIINKLKYGCYPYEILFFNKVARETNKRQGGGFGTMSK